METLLKATELEVISCCYLLLLDQLLNVCLAACLYDVYVVVSVC